MNFSHETPRSLFSILAGSSAVIALLIILGTGWLRLTDAALSCAEWPTCFGQLIPPSEEIARETAPTGFPVDIDGIRIVMGVRYLMLLLVLLLVSINLVGWRNRRDPGQPLVMPFIALLLGIALIGFSRWSTLSLLHPLATAAQMLAVILLFALLSWLAIHTEGDGAVYSEHPSHVDMRPLAIGALVILCIQIVLGVWTSSNYAALHCPDLPTCQGELIPPMDLAGAFSVAPFDNTNHQGGILSNEQGVTVQFVHRIGAVVTLAWFLLVAFLGWKKSSNHCRSTAIGTGNIALIAFILGIAIVITMLSPILSLLHTLTTMVLLYLVLLLLHHSLQRKVTLYRE